MKPLSFTVLATFVGFFFYGGALMGSSQGYFSMPAFALEITVISIIITVSIYMVLARTTKPLLFANIYLLTIVMKLIFFSALLFIMRFIAPKTLMPNALFLLISYVLFTSLEVVVLFRKVNR